MTRDVIQPKLLIVEDELPMRTALSDCLAAEGFRILTADNGETALRLALDQQPDLILADVMMPGLDGFSLCSELRRLRRNVPILMLSARGHVADRVTGLDAGADDYLPKPFSTDELIARVRALLRRTVAARVLPKCLRLNGAEIDFERCTATRSGAPLSLTAKEFAMLRLLAEHEGRPVSREQFLDLVWGVNVFPTTRTVDNHIAALRRKLRLPSAGPGSIETVHGTGYRLILQKDDNPVR